MKVGLITGSLNPLPDLAGRDPIDVIIEQSKALGVLDVELVTVFPQGQPQSSTVAIRPAAGAGHTRIREITPGSA